MKNNYSSVATLDEAALLASDQTMLAYCQGTFSVGGVLIQCSTGEVIHALHNNVVVDGVTQDPTAHGERQLVDWYFEQVDGGATLPSPEDLMVVTSLDPCCMCTGSLASAGFKAVISANDEFAGINYDLSATFPSVTDPETLQNTFSYPAVSGATCFAREESGRRFRHCSMVSPSTNILRRSIVPCSMRHLPRFRKRFPATNLQTRTSTLRRYRRTTRLSSASNRSIRKHSITRWRCQAHQIRG
jgi:tRNA(Arg) A34 adenosine deaminase TadA